MEQAALASEEKKVEEEEKVDDPFTLGELEDEKRNFIVKYRPHKKVWNFIQEDPSERLPHLLRATADPNDAYIDERLEKASALLALAPRLPRVGVSPPESKVFALM